MTYPYILPPLPYAPAALEPNLGRSSVRLHHDAFFAAYVDRLNGALVPWTQYQDWPLERLLLHWCQLPRTLGQAVRRYGGGVYNHGLYFSSLAPARTTKPSGELLAEVEHSFGSMEGLHRSLKNAAMSVFGSGWVWLVCCSGGLQVTCTANQDTPLPLWPLFNMDLWEHAFIPDYENRREDYVEAALAIIDWDAASRRFRERAAAAEVFITDITQKAGVVAFTFDSRVDVPSLMAVCTMPGYRSRLRLSAGEPPRLQLHLSPGEDALAAAGKLTEELRLKKEELGKAHEGGAT